MQGWVRGETNTCFTRSKSMDLNDFLIRNNVLNIRLSRNLITQSNRDRFCEYINKWQLCTYNSSYSEMQVIYISILICYNKFAAYQ